VWEELAEAFKDEPNLVIAKFDATANEAEDVEIRGYPTLLWYPKDNKTGVPYEGERDLESFKKWLGENSSVLKEGWCEKMRSLDNYAEPLKTLQDVKQAIGNSEVITIGFFKDLESDRAKDYLKAVRDYDEYRTSVTTDEEAMKKYDAEDGQVIMFKKYDHKRVVYEYGDITKEKIVEFIQRYSLPLVVEFNHDNAQKMFRGLVKSHILIFISYKSDEYEATYNVAKKLAEEFRNKVMFSTVDTDEDDHRRIIEFLGLKGEKFPTMRIIQMKEDIDKYKVVEGQHDAHDTTNEENLRKFVQDYLDGKVPIHYLTEDLPEDWNKNATKYLTGKNFDQVVFDKEMAWFVKFYAPWCGHCKQLSPIWDKLAETFIAEKKDDIVVAKMDATINELSHSKVRSFPTIRLYRKGTNEFGEYNGERTLEGIKKFVETDGEYGKAAPDHDEL
jgi:protein disulfide-isomerase A1